MPSEGWHAHKGHYVFRARRRAWRLADASRNALVKKSSLGRAGRQWVEDTIYATPDMRQCPISQ